MTTRGNTTVRDRDRAYIRRGQPPCALCHQPIDYTLRSPDPMSFEVDHIVPLSRGGLDILENKQPAHRRCNRAKSARLEGEIAGEATPRAFVTSRTW